MSTTIYNGYRFPEGETLESMIERFRGARTGALALADKVLSNHIINLTVLSLDNMIVQSFAKTDEPKETINSFENLLWTVQRRVQDRKDNGNGHNSDVDMSASIVLIPHDGRLYGIGRHANAEMARCIQEASGAESYSWWNNTDRAEGVSQKSWDKRGEIWEAITRDEGTVSYLGAELELVKKTHPTPILSVEDCNDFSGVNSFHDRVFSAAMKIFAADPNALGGTPGRIASALMDLREGKNPAFELLRAKMAKVLIEFPDRALFGRPIEQVIDEAKARWEAAGLEEMTQQSNTPKPGRRI